MKTFNEFEEREKSQRACQTLSENPWVLATVIGAVGFVAAFVSVFLFMPFLIRFMKQRHIVGVDVHKTERPEIPEMGGIGFVLGLVLGLVVVAVAVFLTFTSSACVPNSGNPICSIPVRFASEVMIGPRPVTGFELDLHSLFARVWEVAFIAVLVGGIGVLDDLRPFKGWQKPVLTFGLPAVPFAIVAFLYYVTRGPLTNPQPKALSYLFTPYMDLPFYGTVTLTILFPLIALIAVSIGANAVNMMDVYNGVMPATVSIVGLSLLVSAIILQRIEAVYLLLPFLGAIGAYYLFNKYPAKIFSGDVGSLSLGAALVTIALVSRLEVVLLMAMIPFIVNGLNTLLTSGFRERREMKARPTYMTPDGRIALNPDPAAPVPLSNLFLLDGAKSEKEMFRMYVFTVGLSSLLAVLTAVVMALGDVL